MESAPSLTWWSSRKRVRRAMFRVKKISRVIKCQCEPCTQSASSCMLQPQTRSHKTRDLRHQQRENSKSVRFSFAFCCQPPIIARDLRRPHTLSIQLHTTTTHHHHHAPLHDRRSRPVQGWPSQEQQPLYGPPGGGDDLGSRFAAVCGWHTGMSVRAAVEPTYKNDCAI